MKNKSILIPGIAISIILFIGGFLFSSIFLTAIGVSILAFFIFRWIEVTYMDFPSSVATLMGIAVVFYLFLIIIVAYGVIKI